MWFSTEDLGVLGRRRHCVDDSIARAFIPILRARLVIVDDIGPLPVSADDPEGAYRRTDAAREIRSLAMSSDLHPSGSDQIIDRTGRHRLVHRLVHLTHVLPTEGDSIRLAGAPAGKGVAPLA